MYTINLNKFNSNINTYAYNYNLSDEFVNNAISLVSDMVSKEWFSGLTDEEMWDAVLAKYERTYGYNQDEAHFLFASLERSTKFIDIEG